MVNKVKTYYVDHADSPGYATLPLWGNYKKEIGEIV